MFAVGPTAVRKFRGWSAVPVGRPILETKIDLDLDAKEAVAAAGHFLAAGRSCVHGRPGKPRSHYWFRSAGLKPRKFKDVDGTTLLEIRIGANLQTVLPPSLHPSGERYRWDAEGQPEHHEAEKLEKVSACIAAAALLARHWPKGSRHDASLVAIGFLVVTQRQAFDATLSMAVGVSAAVPTLVKLTNLLTQLGVRTSGEGRQQNA